MTTGIQIIKNGELITSGFIFTSLWAEYNYIDYIEIDSKGKVVSDFDSHGPKMVAKFQRFIDNTFESDTEFAAEIERRKQNLSSN